MSHIHCHSDNVPKDKRFVIGITLNSLLIILELLYGFASESMALVSDALHNLSDVFTLVLVWFALWLAKRKRTARYTYGFKNVTILASFINSTLLMLVVGAISWEAILRFSEPRPIASNTVMVVALGAVIVNGFTAFLFSKDSQHDISIKGVYLHMAADAGISLSVVLSSFIIKMTGWLWIDPCMGLLIGAVIVMGNWGVFKESSNLILQAAPASIDTNEITDYLGGFENVHSIHDLHIWAISSTETALSAHIRIKNFALAQSTLHALRTGLKKRFNIHHSTIQLETEGTADNCDLSQMENA